MADFKKRTVSNTEVKKNTKRSNVDAWGPVYEVTKSTLSRVPEPVRFHFPLGTFQRCKVIELECGEFEYQYLTSKDNSLQNHSHVILLHNKYGEFMEIKKFVPAHSERLANFE